VLGAAGYLLKDDDPDALPGHVRRVAAGGTAWTGAAAAIIRGRQDVPRARHQGAEHVALRNMRIGGDHST